MIKIEVGTVKATAMNLSSFAGAIAGVEMMSAASDVLRKEVVANISLTDHTLRDLATYDPAHPYARRHGKIQIHSGKTWSVHKQDGTLLQSFKTAVVSRSGNALFQMWFDRSIAPHADYVVKGTRVMHPRNVLWNTATDTNVRKQTMRSIVRVLGKQLKSKGSVRFT